MSEHWLVGRLQEVAAAGAAYMPVHAQFGVRAVDARPGCISFAQVMGPWLLDALGRLCPGAFLVAADAALGSAIATMLPVDTSVMSLTVQAQFVTLDAGRAGDFTVRGEAVAIGAGSGFASGTIVDDHGRLIARIATQCGFQPAASMLPAAVAPLPGPGAWADEVDDGPAEALLAPVARRRTRARVVEPAADPLVVAAVSLPSVRNSRGELQGGVLGLLAEQAITACLVRDAEPMAAAETADLNVTFLRPVRADAPEVEVSARRDHGGRRFALARAHGRDGAGRLVVVASGSRYAP